MQQLCNESVPLLRVFCTNLHHHTQTKKARTLTQSQISITVRTKFFPFHTRCTEMQGECIAPMGSPARATAAGAEKTQKVSQEMQNAPKFATDKLVSCVSASRLYGRHCESSAASEGATKKRDGPRSVREECKRSCEEMHPTPDTILHGAGKANRKRNAEFLCGLCTRSRRIRALSSGTQIEKT